MNRVPGRLHLCSRSLVFEPKDLKLPLLDIKYSNGICLKLLKSMEKYKLKVTPVSLVKRNLQSPPVKFWKNGNFALLNKFFSYT